MEFQPTGKKALTEGIFLEKMSGYIINMMKERMICVVPMTAKEICEAVSGKMLAGDPESIITDICIDSRQAGPGSLFVPIIGEKVDAHKFIAQVLAGDASAVLMSHGDVSYPEKVHIEVTDTVKALGDLAAFYRRKFSMPTIGITGSVGKTSTKEMIAADMAGIIKPGTTVVYWDEEPSVSRVIVEKAREMGAEAVPVSESDAASLHFQNKKIDFSMRSEYYEYIKVCLHTPAVYQYRNAALAVRALERLKDRRITRRTIEEGLAEARWPGRMEEVLPGVVIDGAHNEDGVLAFLESVSHDGCQGRRLLLFSVVSDKRGKEMAGLILKSGLFAKIAAAPMASGRSLTKEQLAEIWDGRAELYDSPEEGFRALNREKEPEDMVYAAGSLYLAGQLLAGGKDD